jgi:thiol-disulfide isomerase/thioredoxin
MKFHGENDDPMIPYFFSEKAIYRMNHWGPGDRKKIPTAFTEVNFYADWCPHCRNT